MANRISDSRLAEIAAAMFEKSRLPVLLLDNDLRVVSASRSFHSQFETSADTTTGRTLGEIGSGAWGAPQLQSLLEIIQADTTQIETYEMDFVGSKGDISRLIIEAHNITVDDDHHSWILLTIEDVTAARLLDRQKDELLRDKDVLLREKDALLTERRILLEEIQHRVANSLQIVASILTLKARAVQSEESRRHLEDAHQRVISIAAIQSQLQLGLEDVAVQPYLAKLCESLSSSMIQGARPLTLAVEADGSTINARDAVSIGLVVTELVINAIKYGFAHEQAGSIIVSYRADALGWTLAVDDDGIGLSATTKTIEGLGTSLVAALAGQLDCAVAREAKSPGLRVSLVHVRTEAKLQPVAKLT
jgi:two-component system, sensor histidine kinase PdtaS